MASFLVCLDNADVPYISSLPYDICPKSSITPFYANANANPLQKC